MLPLADSGTFNGAFSLLRAALLPLADSGTFNGAFSLSVAASASASASAPPTFTPPIFLGLSFFTARPAAPPPFLAPRALDWREIGSSSEISSRFCSSTFVRFVVASSAELRSSSRVSSDERLRRVSSDAPSPDGSVEASALSPARDGAEARARVKRSDAVSMANVSFCAALVLESIGD